MRLYRYIDVQAILVDMGLNRRVLIDLLLAAAGFVVGVAFLVWIHGPLSLDMAITAGVVGAGWLFGIRLVWRYLPSLFFFGSISFILLAPIVYCVLKLWLGMLIGIPALVWRGGCDILIVVRACRARRTT